ncbi:MAG TPA: hypothetical protein VJK51_03650 [Candidatus Nanoarchaeia archaeon]|nr:hypothetical protein [Candidatus Nanoarchaeia archaeon]
MKRGEGESNLLSFLLAIVGIVLVGYAIYQLYLAAAGSEEKNAQKTLDYINGKILALEAGETGKFLIQGFSGAEGWFLLGFNPGSVGLDTMPGTCGIESCVCLCKGKEDFVPQVGVILLENVNCNERGFCRQVDRLVNVYEPLGKDRTNFFNLAENAIQIEIKKEKEKVTIGQTG